MKNKLILLLVAVVVVASLALVGCGEVPPAVGFVSPAKTTYYVGEALDLTGAKIYGEEIADVQLTTSMLDASSYNMAVAGNYTVKGSYNDFEFTFNITVSELPSSTKFVSPAKKAYALGEKLLLDGATVTVDGSTVNVTADMLDATTLPNFNQVGDYTVKGSYQGFDFAFGVKVYAPYEFKHDTDFVYMRAADVAKHVWIRQTDAQGVAGEWTNVSNNDFSKFELTQNRLHVEIEMCVNNYEYSYSADFEFIDVTGVTVSELKSLPVGESTYVNGYVVAITSTIAFNELILADKTTGEVISVRSIPFGGSVHYMDFESPLSVGDEIVIPVTLANAMTATADGKAYSDSGKLYAEYTGGDQIETAVLSKGKTAPISYSNATLVDSQADLKNLLSSTNRAGNVYTMVHLKGQMNFVLYASSRQIRFWFADDTKIDSLAEQKIDDNCSPVFCDGTQYYTTGATFSEMVLGNKSFGNTSYTDPTTGYYDIYALFIGGNNFYHKFVILRAEDAKPMEPTVEGYTVTAPTVVSYPIGSTLNLTGAKVTTKYDIKEDEVADITMDMLDATTIPDFTTAGKFTVKGSYNDYEFSFEIEIYGGEILSVTASNPTNKTKLHGPLDLTGAQITVEYSPSGSAEFDVTVDMLDAYTLALGANTLTGHYQGIEFTFEVTVTDVYSVAEIKNIEEGKALVVRGIVMGVASDACSSDGSKVELLLRDENSNAVIGITGEALGLGTATALQFGIFKQGDLVEFPATIVFSKANYYEANTGKVSLQYAGNADQVSACIKENGKPYAIVEAFGGYTTITKQSELKNALIAKNTDGVEMPIAGAQYKILKFSGKLYATSYATKSTPTNCEYWRVWLDASITSYDKQKLINTKVDGTSVVLSPVFRQCNSMVNLGQSVSQLLWGIDKQSSSVYNTSNCFDGDIYAIFIGGSNYYNQLVIVSVDNVKATTN